MNNENSGTPELREASAVSEYLLDRTGQALDVGDFDTFRDCFLLPQVMETFSGRREIRSTEDLRSIFDNVRGGLAASGVTHMVRRCLSAEYRDPRTIAATHETRLIRTGAILARDPYPVFSLLRHVDGDWRIAYS